MTDILHYSNPKAVKFIQGINSKLRFRLFFFLKIPLVWYSGIYVQKISRQSCDVFLPFKRRTQNPFKSVYFAAQCMAAELSTGLLVMAEILESNKKVSMLVTGMQATFMKKATRHIIFTCQPHNTIIDKVRTAVANKQAVKFSLISKGCLPDGTVVAEFSFEWSIKPKG
ncbi:MAG: DUF4442 domain-containing protein [Bacteroidia bacterium]|nr:DUF4442 domain-containing protein [Bacteroidia bacterium]MCZ2248241.1 DUF4442 domain-containing protein [Bacteroidia bacterium]